MTDLVSQSKSEPMLTIEVARGRITIIGRVVGENGIGEGGVVLEALDARASGESLWTFGCSASATSRAGERSKGRSR